MSDSFRQKLARMLLSDGMAGQAADHQNLYPQWQKLSTEAQMNGQEFPQYEEWAQQQKMQNQPQTPGNPMLN